MTDLLQDNYALPTLSYQRHAPRRRNITDYSSKLPEDKPLPLAPSTCPRARANRNEHMAKRHARIWDTVEVTEALRTFTPDAVQCAKAKATNGQEMVYVIRNRRMGLIQTNKEPPPVPPKDRVTFTTHPPSQIQPALAQGAQIRYPAPTCSICLDDTNSFPRRGPTSRCAHPPTVCAPCLEQYISHSVLTDGLTVITCPIPDCRQTLERNDVIRGANGDSACVARYETLLSLRALESDPNFVRCKSPTCNWGQIHKGGGLFFYSNERTSY
ncbi:unnamed protein product [Rhizoctonia solani]|uniref:RING-type domain-containing protein n=1 Tax=Rhizoctonia solani TaxID=456999 RepID=A0A8H3CL66_9AGAM|nr:unnamed protein product [Rhizoctonia solani]